jgi:uncharacterized protein
MSRILFFGLLACWIVFLFKRKMSPFAKQTKSATQHTKNANKMMVQCASCGLHIPENDALLHNNKLYCSESHFE